MGNTNIFIVFVLKKVNRAMAQFETPHYECYSTRFILCIFA